MHLKLFYSGALLAVFISFLAQYQYHTYEILVIEWSKIIGISFILVIFAITVRELKPAYARYPAPFSYLPLILIAAHPFIRDAEVLKDLLNQLLQGGVIIVAFLLYLSLNSRLKTHFLYLGGFLLFVGAYSIYWFGGTLKTLHPWSWHVPMAIGLLIASISKAEILSVLKKRNY